MLHESTGASRTAKMTPLYQQSYFMKPQNMPNQKGICVDQFSDRRSSLTMPSPATRHRTDKGLGFDEVWSSTLTGTESQLRSASKMPEHRGAFRIDAFFVVFFQLQSIGDAPHTHAHTRRQNMRWPTDLGIPLFIYSTYGCPNLEESQRSLFLRMSH